MVGKWNQKNPMIMFPCTMNKLEKMIMSEHAIYAQIFL